MAIATPACWALGRGVGGRRRARASRGERPPHSGSSSAPRPACQPSATQGNLAMKTIQLRTLEQYATLAAVTRDDLAPHLRPSDWGSGTKNSLRAALENSLQAALEVFDLLAAGAAIVMPTTHEERVAEALQADEQQKALAEQCKKIPKRGDVWRSADGKVALVVDSPGRRPGSLHGFFLALWPVRHVRGRRLRPPADQPERRLS